jgi:hypothetical protein
MPDSIVAAVVASFLQRSELGQKKYGTTLDRTDLKTLDWIQHVQEELMDAILYLERLKKEVSRPSEGTQSQGTQQGSSSASPDQPPSCDTQSSPQSPSQDASEGRSDS